MVEEMAVDRLATMPTDHRLDSDRASMLRLFQKLWKQKRIAMNFETKRVPRIALLSAMAGAAMLIGAGTAAADDWPSDGGAFEVYETKNFAVQSDPDYWNPLSDRNRLTSPYGTNTRIVCTSFHGVQQDCWQADPNGNPHKLTTAPLDVPYAGSSGTGHFPPKHYIYPS